MGISIEAQIEDKAGLENFREELEAEGIEVEIAQESPARAFPPPEVQYVLDIAGDLSNVVITLNLLKDAAQSFDLSTDVDIDATAEEYLEEYADVPISEVTLEERNQVSGGTKHVYIEPETGTRHIVRTDGERVKEYKLEY